MVTRDVVRLATRLGLGSGWLDRLGSVTMTHDLVSRRAVADDGDLG